MTAIAIPPLPGIWPVALSPRQQQLVSQVVSKYVKTFPYFTAAAPQYFLSATRSSQHFNVLLLPTRAENDPLAKF